MIFDRAAVSHNSTKSIISCLEIVNKKLKRDGIFVGIDWFSTEHSDFKYGNKDKDVFTKTDFKSGVFANVGCVHFSNLKHLKILFKSFRFLALEHKLLKSEIPDNSQCLAFWNFVAKKSG